jgi:solute carrier family 25 (mitochondrial S-adenosylmethionine transporter), member 26
MNNDYINLLSGGIARGITVFKLYPIDTIKTNIQNNSQYNFRKLYNGINIALIGQVPYYMIVFGTYEKIKSNLDKKISSYVISAFIADFIAALWLSPFELIKQKKQSNIISTNSYKISELYKGFPQLLLRDIPYRIIKLPLYEVIKDNYVEKKGNIKPYETLIIATFSGMLAAAITNPADSIKTIIMLDNTNKSKLSIIKSAIKKQGYSIFYKGMMYRTIYTGLSNGIFFTYYELLKNSYNIIEYN